MKSRFAAIIASALVISLSLLTPNPLFARGGGGHGGMGHGGTGSSTQPQNATSVAQGQLSTAEVDRLKTRIETLTKLSDSLEGDAKLTADELTTLSDSLTAAAASIWSKGSDDDGNITTRFGDKFVFIPKLVELLKSGPLTRPQARELLKNFTLMMKSRLALNEADLSPEDRTKTQKSLDDLITKYFTTA